jgi:multisubunit Na+/H+ antiporter MnhB subunit
MAYRLLADAALLAHFAFVLFVVLGLVTILVGGARGWDWVRNRRFRVAHLAAIGVVVAQAWLGILCPLTRLEMWARARAGEATYSGSFIAHWVERALYYEAPLWVFALAYTLFGALVVLAWYRVPPARRRSGRGGETPDL